MVAKATVGSRAFVYERNNARPPPFAGSIDHGHRTA